jgi:HlyD family secretion protein
MTTKFTRWIVILAAAAIAAGGALTWWKLRPPPLPPGFVSGNGRIEATQIDIATKLPGRIKDVLVREGDFVEAGQTVAHMDTQTLQAELRQGQAQVAQARNALETAKAVVAQRESELAYAESMFKRSEELVRQGFVSPQKLDGDRNALLTARAALVAARASVAQAQSGIDAAIAATQRIDADIQDSTLKALRAGRVQYRLAEPGEVLAAGGKVVSMLDLSDVYMTLFLPEMLAGRLAIGGEVRLIFDAAPQYVVPATITFVAVEAQFTPKTVETATERQKLTFRVKAQIAPELLRKYLDRVKTGVPGVAYVRLDRNAPWPPNLEVKLPPT